MAFGRTPMVFAVGCAGDWQREPPLTEAAKHTCADTPSCVDGLMVFS